MRSARRTESAMETPVIHEVEAERAHESNDLRELVEAYRSQAQAFLFLSGGASRMSESVRGALLELFRSLELLARRGLRFAVGDGGTRAGIMEAAGTARRRSGGAFALLGVAPAPEILPVGAPGKTPVDDGHGDVIAVRDPAWEAAKRKEGWEPSQGYWGSETKVMYQVFARLAEGRPSVAVVANGGSVTFDEVAQNIAQGREMIVVAGSGRTADALLSVLERRDPAEEEAARLRERAQDIGVAKNRALVTRFPLSEGPTALADLLAAKLSR
jgi:SLOG in TRPM, prokaryote